MFIGIFYNLLEVYLGKYCFGHEISSLSFEMVKLGQIIIREILGRFGQSLTILTEEVVEVPHLQTKSDETDLLESKRSFSSPACSNEVGNGKH